MTALHLNYCQDWSLEDARRELLQNALDAGLILKGDYVLQNKGSLPEAAFILGYSSKRNDSSKLGQFGEGLKLAMLVYAREGQPITVCSNGRAWTTEIDTELGEPVCRFVEAPEKARLFRAEYPFMSEEWLAPDQTTIVFERAQHWDMLEDTTPRVLPNNPVLYVGGLRICSLEGVFKHGYNLAPGTIALNRDRRAVDYYQLAYQVKDLLLQSKDLTPNDLAKLILDSNYRDAIYLEKVPELRDVVLRGIKELNLRPTKTAGGYWYGITSAAASYLSADMADTKEQTRLKQFLSRNKRRMSKEARADLATVIKEIHK